MNTEESSKKQRDNNTRANLLKEHATLLNITEHIDLQLKDLQKEEQVIQAMLRKEEENMRRLQAG